MTLNIDLDRVFIEINFLKVYLFKHKQSGHSHVHHFMDVKEINLKKKENMKHNLEKTKSGVCYKSLIV